MKSTFLLAPALLVLTAQEIANESEYRERMQEVDHSFAHLQAQRNVRHGAEIEREAARLSDLFGEVERFWKGRGNEDAAGFARMAREGADEVGEAARKNEQRSLDAALSAIAASCEGCHREPLDKYRFGRS